MTFNPDPLALTSVRTLAWRLGRKLYRYARRDGLNDPAVNGEYRLLDFVIAKSEGNLGAFLDIGANKGDWTARARLGLSKRSADVMVYAFEPTPTTFSFLKARFEADRGVVPIQEAMSDEVREADLFVLGDLEGTNSLFDLGDGTPTRVQTGTVDRFCLAHSISRLGFVKSDTEGNDFRVMQGAAHALEHGVVDLWQFEYNWRWIYARAFLRDVFEFVAAKPYIVGKVHSNGVELFESWHPELERYFEGNYLLVKKGLPIATTFQHVHFGIYNEASATR